MKRRKMEPECNCLAHLSLISLRSGEAPGDEETATEGGENAEPVDFMAAIRKAKEV